MCSWSRYGATSPGWTPDDRRAAVREDSGHKTTDVLVVLAAVASLGAVALLLSSGSSSGKDLQALLSVGSVALAWASVHTMYTTRYARLYYTGEDGGIDFNEHEPPTYIDFAYLAFTIGMTFQVSDTMPLSRWAKALMSFQSIVALSTTALVVTRAVNVLQS